ncbi:hypothetical protein MMC07_000496 [Pseudocyphellaria aurata]|nr:hypothetical protein [Pseudocyphellaria aurata]
MLRFRRYRVFLIFAVIAIGALYHFTTFGDLENARAVGVEGLRSLGHKDNVAHTLPPVPPPIEIEKLPEDDTQSSLALSSTDPTNTPSPTIDEDVEDELVASTPTSSFTTTSPTIAEPEDELIASTPSPTSAVDEEAVQKPLVGNDGSTRDAKSFKPFLADTQDDFGEARLDGVSDVRDTPIHWSQLPEQFPVPTESLISLPSGKPKVIPKIQHVFSDESANDKIDRLQKLETIKGAFATSWNGYKKNAWMHDELSPVSGLYRDPFCGWAATLVDTLDTLWIMGMKEEFEEATNAMKNIDFTTSNRQEIPVFETVIRYLGGLIAAYDLSSGTYRILLDKAVELAEVLMGAFDTPNRMPMTFYPWKPTFSSNPHRARTRVVLAELGSLSVEFTRLAQITKKAKYYDAVARITNELETWQNNTKMPGLWPMKVDASGCKKADTTKSTQVEHSLLNGPRNDIPQLSTGPSLSENGTSGAETTSSLDGNARKDASPEKSDTEKQESSDLETVQETNLVPGIDALSKSKVGTIKRQLSDDAIEMSSQSTTTTSDETTEPDCEAQGLASPPYSDSEDFTLGGQADSTYEYLPKEYMLLGGLEDVYRTMYEKAIETVKKYLLFRPMIPDERDILLSGLVRTTGDLENPNDIALKPEGTHLTCFVGGMFAVGAKIFDRTDDLVLAQKLTDGCVWAYESTTTGIMPEHYLAAPCEGLEKCAWNETKYYQLLDPDSEYRQSQANEENEQAVLRSDARKGAIIQTPEETEAAEASPTAQGDAPRETQKATSMDSTAQADISQDSGPISKTSPRISADDSEGSEGPNSEGVSSVRADGPKESEESSSKVGSLTRRQLGAIESESPLKPAAETAGTPTKDDPPEPQAGYLKSNNEKEKEIDEDPKGDSKAVDNSEAKYTPMRKTDDDTKGDSKAVDNSEAEYTRPRKTDDDPKGDSKAVDNSEAEYTSPHKTYDDPKGDSMVVDNSEAKYTPRPPPTTEEYAKSRIKNERLPLGMIRITGRSYILRPEAIESVFIMYRVTGDPYWRDKGWLMFESINKYTAGRYGASAIDDVTAKKPSLVDEMESFWLAETLKYFFLLFSDPDVISLDDYVL